MKWFLACAACLVGPVAAFADERISLVIGHPGAAWQAHCIVNLSADGKMTTQLQLSRDSMPAPVLPVEGMDFLSEKFTVLREVMLLGAWPQSVQEDEVREAPFILVVYTQREGDDITLERRVFQQDLVLDSHVKDLFAPLHDGRCLTPPPL